MVNLVVNMLHNLRNNKKILPWLIILFEIPVYLSMDMFSVCLGEIATDFVIDQDLSQASVTIWFIGLLIVQLFIGPISDYCGRRPITLLGLWVFFIGSILCMWTTDYNIFLLGRLLQGAATAIPLIVGRAILHETFEHLTTIKIFAIMGSITILAPSLGPLLGALVSYYSNWRNIFVVLSGWSLLVLWLNYQYLFETNQHPHTFCIKDIVLYYWKILLTLRFLQYSLPISLGITGIIIWIVEIPFVMQAYGTYTVITTGLIQLVVFLPCIVSSMIIHKMLNYYSPTVILKCGFSVALLGTMILFGLLCYFGDIFVALPGVVLFVFGLSLCFGPANRMSIATASGPVGYRTAMYSIVQGGVIVIGMYLYSFFNSVSAMNLAVCLVIVALLSWLIIIFVDESVEA